jgi:serralysin
VAGNSTTLESLEVSFNQDLNGDGVIGILVHTDANSIGTTSLTQVGNNYYLYNGSGVGPELKYMGAPVTTGEFGAVTPIGAALTSTGYEVAWQFTGTNYYTVWNTDSNGNDVSDTIGIVAGNSTTLESLETSFNQDLNGDGAIGSPPGVHEVASNSAATNSTANAIPDNFHFTGEGSEMHQASAFSAHADGRNADTPNGATVMATHNAFLFAPDSGASNSGNAGWADGHAAPAGAHSDALSNDSTHAGAHGAQWLAHHDFHLI